MEFGVLGPLLVRDADRPVILPSAKQRALLATLLLESGHDVVGTERLIDELWGEDPPTTAMKALQVHVSQLRRALGPQQPIVTRPTGYAIRVDPDAFDLQRFEALIAAARRLRADGDRGGAIQALDRALGLWRGPALADVVLLGPGAVEAARLEGFRAVASEERIELRLLEGAAGALVPELESLIAAHPYRERMHGLLMLALYKASRQADALEAFRRARQRLVEDLGLEPGPDLVALESAILAQDPAAEASYLGVREVPAKRTLRSVPAAAGIPRPATAILGREAELHAALRLIEQPDVRVLTLTGPGGIGKTRLALELASRLDGGSRFVELAAVSDPERVLPAIGAAVGADEPTHAAIAAALGDAAVVLFLDNFEQVLEAAPVVSSLLTHAHTLRLVVTSRAPLRISGEHELPIPPLPQASAVELFVGRAREHDPGFSPGPEELESITAVCDRIDGLPLAIELAAARTRVLTPREILDRIARRLDLLTAGRRDAPERHRTLRGTIAWSHELLEAQERRLFARLAAFHGGWSIDAAEAVSEEDVLEALSALVDHALVIRDGSRFTMLETVREYAVERLDESGEAATIRRRHAQWCVALARRAERELEGPELARWFALLDREQENLRAAAVWAVTGGEPELALAIHGPLWRFWLARGAAAEIRDVLRDALAPSRGDGSLRAKAMNAAGILSGASDDFDAARDWFAQAVALAREVGDRRQMGRALGNLGMIAMFAEDYAAARDGFRAVLAIWRELGDVMGQSIMTQNLAIAHELEGDSERAIPLLEESIELARAADDGMQVAITVLTLGRFLLYHEMSDHRIPALLREGLERSIALGGRHLTAEGLEVIAHLALSKAEPTAAARLIGAADAERERAGARRKPDEARFFEITVQKLEQTLGADCYVRERERGRRAPLESAVALALKHTEEGQQAA